VNAVTFYATAAQVIPVLALALMVERRVFDVRREEPVDWTLFLLAALVILTGGEAVALAGTLGADSTPARLLVAFAIMSGLFGLLVPAYGQRFERLRSRVPKWPLRLLIAAWIAPVLLTPFAVLHPDDVETWLPATIFFVYSATISASLWLERREPSSAASSEAKAADEEVRDEGEDMTKVG